MADGNPEAELAKVQRNQFAHYIVRIGVALGLVDGKDPYTGDQVAFLARTAIDAICSTNQQWIILERNRTSEELAGKYVELYAYADGQAEVQWKGFSLPYRVFSKDQRVSHTAIVENKRLGHALSIVKAQQELKRETKVLTNSEKTRYKKRPRQIYGPDVVEKTPAPKSGGNAGLRKAWKTDDESVGLPPFP